MFLLIANYCLLSHMIRVMLIDVKLTSECHVCVKYACKCLHELLCECTHDYT